MRLSVLVCGVPSRLAGGPPPLLELLEQAKGKSVEVLYLLDNKMRTVGEKRTAILSLALGDYVSAVDDDDEVLPGYIDTLLAATETNPDVIVFPIKVTLDGEKEGVVHPNIHQPTQEGYTPGGVTKRRPVQNVCWRRELVQHIKFPSIQYGEDHIWGDLASAQAKTQVVLDKVLYHYKFSSATTEASK